MANFTKQAANLVVDGLSVNGTTALLGDDQLTQVMFVTNALLERTRYASLLNVTEQLEQGSITVLRQGGIGEFTEKTKLGSGTSYDGGSTTAPENVAVEEITVYADKVFQKTNGIGKVDIELLSESVVPVTVRQHFDLIMLKIDRGFFTYITKLRTTVVPADPTKESLDPNAVKHFIGKNENGDFIPGVIALPIASANEIFTSDSIAAVAQKLSSGATTLSQVMYGNDGKFGSMGITGIPQSDIFIDLVPQLFDALVAKFGLVTRAPEIVEEGVKSVTEWGGYKIYSNIRLLGQTTQDGKAVLGIAGSGHVGVAPWKLIAQAVKQPGPSEDSTVYTEVKLNSTGGNVIFDAFILFVADIDEGTYATELAGLIAFASTQVVVAANGAPLATPLQAALRAYVGAHTVADTANIVVNSTTPVNAATVTANTAFTASITVPVVSGKSAIAATVTVSPQYKNA